MRFTLPGGNPPFLNRLWDDMNRLQREILWQIDPRSRAGREFPAVNIRLTPEGAELSAELPGVKSGDLDLQVSGRTVTLKGERRSPAPADARWQRRECPEGAFSRVIELPFALEPGAVEARLSHGLLRAKLPRAEADKPRKVKVAEG